VQRLAAGAKYSVARYTSTARITSEKKFSIHIPDSALNQVKVAIVVASPFPLSMSNSTLAQIFKLRVFKSF
jgi:hypothetical protein